MDKNDVTFYRGILLYVVFDIICLCNWKITSSIIVFFKDLGQIVNIVLQIGLWVTPIIWSYIIVPEKFQWIVKLNPVFYIVEGYRDSFIEGKWFFQKPLLTVYFGFLHHFY